MRQALSYALFVILLVAGSSSRADPIPPEAIGQASQVIGPIIIHEREGNRLGANHDAVVTPHLLFTAYIVDFIDPGLAGFYVWNKFTGDQVGVLPWPVSGHWWMPFMIKLADYEVQGLAENGHIYVMDGFAPLTTGVIPARIVEYSYSYNWLSGEFSATEVRETAIPVDDPMTPELDGTLYPSSFEQMDDGRLVIADTFVGGLYVSDPNWGNIHLAYVSPVYFQPTFFPQNQTIHIFGVDVPGCTVPTYHSSTDETVDVPMSFHVVSPSHPGALLPGLHGVAYVTRDDKVAFCSPTSEGGIVSPIGMLDRTVLIDDTIPPYAKDGYLDHLVPATDGLTDWVAEIVYDKWDAGNPWVYFQRIATSLDDNSPYAGTFNTIYRVNLDTRAVELVMEDVGHKKTMFPTNMNMVAGLAPNRSCLTMTNTVEHLNSVTNMLHCMFGPCDDTQPVPLPLENLLYLQSRGESTGVWVSMTCAKN